MWANVTTPRRNRLDLGLLLLAAAFVALVADAKRAIASIVSASNFPSSYVRSGFRTDVGYATPNGEFVNTTFSQPFVALVGGRLEAIESLIGVSLANSTQPLRVSIREDANGIPGIALGESLFPPNLFPARPFSDFNTTLMDMTALEIDLQAGRIYHAVFRTEAAMFYGSYYSAYEIEPHEESFNLPKLHNPGFGTHWRTTFSLEVPLKVTVVPEPSACALVLVGAGISLLPFASQCNPRGMKSGRRREDVVKRNLSPKRK